MSDEELLDLSPLVTLYATEANGSTIALEAVRRGRYRQRFCTMFTPALAQLASLDRPACYHRTLLHLLTVLDPIQPRKVSAREIAEATGQSQASVERALTMLTADQVLLTNSGKTGALARRLNNRVCWMATADLHSRAGADPEVSDARGR